MGVSIVCDGCGRELEAGMVHERDTLLAAVAVRGLRRGGAVAEGPGGGILVACCESCRHTVTAQYGKGRRALYVSRGGTIADEPSKPI